MARLARSVVVADPATRKSVVLRKGDDLPGWAAGLVTNRRALEHDAPTVEPYSPTPPADTGGPQEPAPPADELDPPTDATIAEILDAVGDDPDLAARYLEAERAKGEEARKTLLERLAGIADTTGLEQ